MSMKAHENIKTLLIAVLLVSAVTLGYFSSLFDSLASAFNSSNARTAITTGFDGSVQYEAARPAVIVATDSSGARAVVKYDMDALDAIYERPTSGLFNEAFTVCGDVNPCTEDDWRAALGSEGVMYEYYSLVPLELVRDWLGASGDGFGLNVLRICLSYTDGGAALYFESSNGFFTAETSVPAGDFTFNAAFTVDSLYDFERNTDSATPYLMQAADYTHPTAVSSNPLFTASLDKPLAGLGIDIRQATSYPDNDGTEFYISSLFTLSITRDGVVNYRRAVQESGGVTTLRSAVALARSVVAAALSVNAGDARVYFSGYQKDGDSITVFFDYYFAGGRVFLNGSDNAARITVSNGIVSEFTLCCRSFSSGERIALLPEKQAAAISPSGFALGYSDSGSSAPFWYFAEDVK